MRQEVEQMSIFDQDLWCGKTCPEHSARTEEQTSEQFSKRRSKSSAVKPPLFLCLEKDGLRADALPMWKANGALLGEFSTRSFGEFPNVDEESHLSQILEDSPHPKYSLSEKACQGILRRAQRRGKELPQLLKNALEQQAFGTQNGYDQPTIIQGTYIDKVDTTIVCMATQQGGAEIRTDDKAPTLTAAAGMSGNNQPVICIQGNCIDRADTAGCNGKGWTEDVSYTLNTIDRPAVAQSVPLLDDQGGGRDERKRFCESRSDTPRSDARKFADCGGKEGRIVAGFKSNPSEKAGSVAYGIETAPCLSAATHDACVMVLENHPNDSGINSSLVAKGPSAVCSKEKSECERYIVRRLTPLECERLQGFPDQWTDIGEWTDSKGKLHKESSDSARYKALGNSIALPSWFYVLSKLSEFCEEKTMASLFDGIGGFPLIWETLNGKGSCLWASEIEEFPMAVTKHHLGEAESEKVFGNG